ncbi:hypothetical protein AAFF_G00060450 [Aldrovandia affinis]|uniref:Uncharacterized protein n=1 Tax=Aldrovandia affinis TaxID=143900 RepID=A0AAD7S093_9TELE|nr:hypothetical protein AAFF_G00060450 [Aldrovandia affinis]
MHQLTYPFPSPRHRGQPGSQAPPTRHELANHASPPVLWRFIPSVPGYREITSAHLSSIVDEPGSWPLRSRDAARGSEIMRRLFANRKTPRDGRARGNKAQSEDDSVLFLS